ncbi:MAG: WD40/YVTN/BNR-like repeat-containing protein [bacterium]
MIFFKNSVSTRLGVMACFIFVGFNFSAFAQNWTQLSIPTTQTMRSIHFFDANTGWAVGENGLILATTDGGASWSPETSGVTTTLWRFRRPSSFFRPIRHCKPLL